MTAAQALAIRRLAAQATIIGALLGAIDTLALERQEYELAVCSSMADDLARDLDLLSRSAT